MHPEEALTAVDHDLVRRLLADQHPDLADRPLTTVREGSGGTGARAPREGSGDTGTRAPLEGSGDTGTRAPRGEVALVRLGQHFAMRLPLDRDGAERLRRETEALAEVAARTGADAGTRTGTGKGVRAGAGVDVPRPVRAGDPTDYYPWRWSIVRWVPGRPAAGQAVRARAFWSSRLARFLADLHESVAGEPPTGEVAAGGVLADHDVTVRTRLADPKVVGVLDDRADEVVALWEQVLASAGAASGLEPVPWVHGRLDPGRLLVERGRLVGVTGFGGMGPGDPAADLAAAWLNFELDGRVGLVVRYSQLTGADDAWWLRARAWAVVRATELLAGREVTGGAQAAAAPGDADAADEQEAVVIGRHTIGELLDAPDALSRLQG